MGDRPGDLSDLASLIDLLENRGLLPRVSLISAGAMQIRLGHAAPPPGSARPVKAQTPEQIRAAAAADWEATMYASADPDQELS